MYCRKCGNFLSEDTTVCQGCNTRVTPAVYCHNCAAELPANSSVCPSCNTKSRAHTSGIHWLPIGLTFVSLICFMFGGYYRLDEMGVQNYDMPYANIIDFLGLCAAIAAIIVAAVCIPKTRMVLKVISLILAGVMAWLTVDWILYALF